MPGELEQLVDVAQMTDLLAFLTARP
jgi:hypothetical protein